MDKKLLIFGTAFIILGVLALIFSGLSYAVLHGTNDAPLGFYHLWNVMLKISVHRRNSLRRGRNLPHNSGEVVIFFRALRLTSSTVATASCLLFRRL